MEEATWPGDDCCGDDYYGDDYCDDDVVRTT